jgi:hypothetical protein
MYTAARFAVSRHVGLGVARGRIALAPARGEFGRGGVKCIKEKCPKRVGQIRYQSSSVGEYIRFLVDSSVHLNAPAIALHS